MPVQLTDNNNPIAWGETVVGEDIAEPPKAITSDPNKRAKWDGSQWIEDPDFTPPKDIGVNRSKISAASKTAFRDARANGDLQTQLDIIFEMLTGEQP